MNNIDTAARPSAEKQRGGFPPIGTLLEVVGFCTGCGNPIYELRTESPRPGGWYSQHSGDCTNVPDTSGPH